MQIVTVDVGGTHARFAIANIERGEVLALGETVTLRTSEFANFQTAWEEFARRLGHPLPRAAAIAIAGLVGGDVIKLTNNQWIFRPQLINESLGVDHCLLLNDFEAVGHAVAQVQPEHFAYLSGPNEALPELGTISIIGPGTGLGVAHLWRDAEDYRVQPTEGGHIDFAPLDSIEDLILAQLRCRYRRVSVERVISGPGLAAIYGVLAQLEGRLVEQYEDKMLWELATIRGDSLAAAAADRFCLLLGSIAGDLALAHGATGVVIAGGLGLRIKNTLVHSGFGDRFRAKGRFETMMSKIPVKLITHPQPGNFGAAAAFAKDQQT